MGRLLDYLDESGLAENTLVVYSSDQGFFLGEHGWYDKRFMYEPSLRMPFIVRWPGRVEAGRRNRHLDPEPRPGAPTLLEAGGLTPAADIQGRSLLPLLAGEEPADWRESIYYEYFERGIHAVQPHYGVRTKRYKLIHFHELDQWELFDLVSDPDELHNRIGEPELAEVQSSLEAELLRLRAECGAG